MPATRRQPCRALNLKILWFAFLPLLFGGCRESAGPEGRTRIEVHAGDDQFGTANETLADVLQVRVTDPARGHPVQGVRVDWQVTDGSAVMTPAASTTDERGIATTSVRLGATLGETRVRATSEAQTGAAALFSATTVLRPSITAVAPAIANAGDTITITGADFSTNASVVLFDGISGAILTADAGTLRVIVPPCVSTRTASVVIATGSVTSDPALLQTVASGAPPLVLARGEVRVLDSPAEFQCVRIPAQLGASYLLVAQNVGAETTASLPFTLAALGVSQPLVAAAAGSAARSAVTDAASDFELALRRRERALAANAGPPLAAARVHADLPVVGSRRAFNTLAANGGTARINATVVAITQRAILYRDVTTPAVFTTADYERFGALFDDPIYSTEAAVFGQPGDVDGNDRVIIVFTPQVNTLTPPGSNSYIAGYFYACDLLSRTRCSESNGGEIFYSMVPDPGTEFGDAHSGANVIRSVPPVLAHELQHMISYSARDGTADELWLAEGLAHSAEDIVADVLEQRTDSIAADFRAANHANARRYLANVDRTALVDDVSPGTVELRGGSWLLLRYLRGHYGGDGLLRALTVTTATGTANLAAATGLPWRTLLADFAIAIYADDNPALADVALPARLTFPDFDVNSALSVGGFNPLALDFFGFSDFALSGALPPASQQYAYVQSPLPGTDRLNVVFSGQRGGAFGNGGSPRLIVMRVR